MSELVGDLQADKKYYQTNIALAASSLAAKTTALAAQLATAAASSGTYGFNAGIEFDIDALERQLQAQQTQSIPPIWLPITSTSTPTKPPPLLAQTSKPMQIMQSTQITQITQSTTNNGQININSQNLTSSLAKIPTTPSPTPSIKT
ncbi:hypothetical protein BSPWISOXPB_4151 [uncultured Gammaproteobacteria bacterium]|nr:hypothetical protein BSPWISOXPB_4151 [uncultured Gammaproteobacteria bacterium]